MDIVSIEDFEIQTTIGVLDWERQIKQTLYFDLIWETDASVIANTDDLVACVDYMSVSRTLQEFVENSAFFLIETLAEKSAAHLLSTFKLSWLRLKLTKPGVIPNAKNVSITIERRSNITT